jgi:methyl-accepting chemotaxis protein
MNGRIATKLITPLLFLALFLAAGLGSTVLLARGQATDALEVNLAWRQGMLSQRMLGGLLLYGASPTPERKGAVGEDLAAFDRGLSALARGGPAPEELRGRGAVLLPPPPEEARILLERVEPLWREYRGLLEAALGGGSADGQRLAALGDEILGGMNRVAEVFRASAERKILRMEQIQGGLTLLGFILVLGCLVYWRHALIRPVKRLREIAEDLAGGGGDLTVRVPVSGGDEIGGLETSFNSFLESLRMSIGETSQGFRDVAFHSANVDRKLTTFSESFAAMGERLASGEEAVQEITGATEEQSAATEELSSTTQTLARMAEDLSRASGEIARSAGSGREALESVRERLGALRGRMDRVSASARDLSGRAGGITDVLRVIAEIADQTNLLALNAAIEAARAGEAGRGFAVVAEEVRTLAEDSRKAVRTIGESLAALVEGVGSAVSGIEEAVGEVRELGTVNEGTSATVASILDRIREVEDLTQSVAAGAEEQGASSHEIAESSQRVAERAVSLSGTMRLILEEVRGMDEATKELNAEMGTAIREIRAELKGLAAFRTQREEDFAEALDQAVEKHLAWTKRLDEMVRSGRAGDLETDPERCAFGIFLSSAPVPKGFEAEWGEIETRHEAFHRLGAEGLGALARGDGEGAIRAAERARTAGEEIVRRFRSLAATLRSGRKGESVGRREGRSGPIALGAGSSGGR